MNHTPMTAGGNSIDSETGEIPGYEASEHVASLEIANIEAKSPDTQKNDEVF